VPPVHEDVVQGTVEAVGGKQGKGLRQKVRELELGHLAGCHFEILVLDCSEASSMSGNLHVVGWIGEHHVGTMTIHQRRVAAAVQGVSAVDSVAPKQSQITGLADPDVFGLRQSIGGIVLRLDRRRKLAPFVRPFVAPKTCATA